MVVQTNAGDMYAVRVLNWIEDPGIESNTFRRALMKSYKYSTFIVKFGAMAYSTPPAAPTWGNTPERVAVLDPALKNPGRAKVVEFGTEGRGRQDPDHAAALVEGDGAAM
jgi:hypothetical protein